MIRSDTGQISMKWSYSKDLVEIRLSRKLSYSKVERTELHDESNTSQNSHFRGEYRSWVVLPCLIWWSQFRYIESWSSPHLIIRNLPKRDLVRWKKFLESTDPISRIDDLHLKWTYILIPMLQLIPAFSTNPISGLSRQVEERLFTDFMGTCCMLSAAPWASSKSLWVNEPTSVALRRSRDTSTWTQDNVSFSLRIQLRNYGHEGLGHSVEERNLDRLIWSPSSRCKVTILRILSIA